MKAELKIGNLIADEFYPDFSKVITVESINDKGINLEIQNSDDYPELQRHWIEPEYTFEQLRGIPLTEEWLLKFGFDYSEYIGKSSSFFFKYVGGSELHINPLNGVVWIERDDNVFNNPALIEYVHQLQNLYYALTGTEL